MYYSMHNAVSLLNPCYKLGLQHYNVTRCIKYGTYFINGAKALTIQCILDGLRLFR